MSLINLFFNREDNTNYPSNTRKCSEEQFKQNLKEQRDRKLKNQIYPLLDKITYGKVDGNLVTKDYFDKFGNGEELFIYFQSWFTNHKKFQFKQ